MIAPGLIAQLPFIDSAREALSSGPSRAEVFAFVLSVAALLALLGLAIWWTRRRQRRPRIDYLTAAVDVAGLSEQDRRDLRFVAHHAELRYPASMLLTPANFSRACRQALDKTAQPAELRSRLDGLAGRLFGDDQPPDAPGEPEAPDGTF